MEANSEGSSLSNEGSGGANDWERRRRAGFAEKVSSVYPYWHLSSEVDSGKYPYHSSNPNGWRGRFGHHQHISKDSELALCRLPQPHPVPSAHRSQIDPSGSIFLLYLLPSRAESVNGPHRLECEGLTSQATVPLCLICLIPVFLAQDFSGHK